MDPATYQRWWALHLRAAKGETLTAEDQAYYETVQRQLDQEETLGAPAAGLAETYAAIRSLEAERASLEARHQQLSAEIAALEAALEERARHREAIKG